MDSQGHLNYIDKPPAKYQNFVPEDTKPLTEILRDAPRYTFAVVPIRLMIFILTLLYISAMIYLTFHSKRELKASYPPIMAGVGIIFLIFAALHIVGYFGDFEILEVPMIFISCLGIVCFVFLANTSLLGGITTTFTRYVSFIACYIIAILHTADFLLAIVYWRHKYSYKRKLGQMGRIHTTLNFNTYTETLPPYTEVDKYNVHTSKANTGTILHYEDSPYQTLQMKRNDAPSLKSYVEFPAPSAIPLMASAGIQSNYSPVQRGVQTTMIDVKARAIQTASKCGLCHRHIDVVPRTPTFVTSPLRDPTIATSPYKSVPVPTAPMHLTPSASPTPRNLICLCKH